MAVKKIKKETIKEKQETKKEKYFYAVGRRKTAVAQVFLYSETNPKEGDITVNKKNIKEYFPTLALQNVFFSPAEALGIKDKIKAFILVKGGGKQGQVEASRLGIARALVKMDESFKKPLKGLGFLTRDARKVERKKPGLKKARRAPQWQKR